MNLSIAMNSPPPLVDQIEAELRAYSAERCARVTERARREADVAISAVRLVAIYQSAIDQHRAAPPDPRAEILAISRYLRELVPMVKMTDNFMGRYWSGARRSTSLDELSARVTLLEHGAKHSRE